MKTFTSDGLEPIPFTIDGVEPPFLAVPKGQVPGGVLFDLAKKAGDPASAADAVLDFISVVLMPDSRAAFQERWMGRVSPAISAPMVASVVKWLMEDWYAPAHPTAGSSPSQNGQRTTSQPSMAGVLPMASTP